MTQDRPYHLVGAIIFFVMLLLLSLVCRGEEYTDTDIVNAIYKAEGADKATYPYGIRSVKCEGLSECRQVCLNTVRNHRNRHLSHDCKFSYLECLSRRYAPLNAKNDPKGLNKNWLKNVKFFLAKYERLTKGERR